MNTIPNDPAFAVPLSSQESDECEGYATYSCHEGLTKREYFAAHALQGLFSNAHTTRIIGTGRMAVEAADDLIKELNKTKEGKTENENED